MACGGGTHLGAWRCRYQYRALVCEAQHTTRTRPPSPAASCPRSAVALRPCPPCCALPWGCTGHLWDLKSEAPACCGRSSRGLPHWGTRGLRTPNAGDPAGVTPQPVATRFQWLSVGPGGPQGTLVGCSGRVMATATVCGVWLAVTPHATLASPRFFYLWVRVSAVSKLHLELSSAFLEAVSLRAPQRAAAQVWSGTAAPHGPRTHVVGPHTRQCDWHV